MLYEHVSAKEIDIVNVLQAKCVCFTFSIFIAQRLFEFNLFIFIVELSENWSIVGETCAAAY